MTDSDKTKRSPFFARFLEGQRFPQVKTDVKAGWDRPTLPAKDGLVTQKYPSDDDEGETS
jgi:hypothetical protein